MRETEKIRLQMKLQRMLFKELEHELCDFKLMDVMKEIEIIVRNFEEV